MASSEISNPSGARLMVYNSDHRRVVRGPYHIPLVLIIFILAALSSSVTVQQIPHVNAQPSPSLTIQPVSQPLATPGSAVVFHVTVQGMPANFAGWDLYVIADNTVLTPTAITLCNNITCNTPYSDSGGTNFMPSGTDAQCINNVNSGAFNNCGSFDGPCLAHDTFASSGSTLGGLLLFDVTFNAVAGPGATVGFPESVTSSTSQNQFFDTSGIGIFGVSETGGTYGTVGVPFDYSLSNNGPVSVTQGSSGTVTVTATLTGGTAQPVTLSCSGLPSGITCGSFTVNPVTPTTAGATSVLTIKVASALAVGPHRFGLTGSPVCATAGVPATSTITISPLNGFTGDVALVSDNAACTVTPTTVTGGSGNSVLSCTFGAAGTVTVTVTATSASLSHSTTVTYTVTSLPDFAISANPTAVTVTVGSAGTSTITI